MPLFVNDGQSPIDAAGLSQAEHDALDHSGLPGVAVESLFHAGTPTTSDVTYAMPANTLNVDLDYVEVIAWGAIVGGASAGVGITFAGGLLVASASGLADGTNWLIRATILRTGAASQQIEASVMDNEAGGAVNVSVSTGAVDLTAVQNISVGEDGGGGGDAEVQGMIVRKHRAP